MNFGQAQEAIERGEVDISTLLDATHLITTVEESRLLLAEMCEVGELSAAATDVIVRQMISGPSSEELPVRALLGEPPIVPVNRWYHGPRHLARMWQEFKEGPQESSSTARMMAQFFLFHDAVYGVGLPGQSEALSAELYVRWMGPNYEWEVAHAILRSANFATHSPFLSDFVKKCLDHDLYELATPRYWVNAVLIRREMKHVEEEKFVVGRLAFIKSMLMRPKLYYKRADLDAKARRNMAFEHDALAAYEKYPPWVDWPNNLPTFVDRTRLPSL